ARWRNWFLRITALVFALGSVAGGAVPLANGQVDANPPAVRTDPFGDRLPPGAVARIGTTRFRNPHDRVSSIAFSPDGKTVAACYHDRIFLWDLVTARELRRFGKFSANDRVVFSPDGTLLASTNYHNQFLHLWDVATGKELHRFRIWSGPVV